MVIIYINKIKLLENIYQKCLNFLALKKRYFDMKYFYGFTNST